MLSRMGLGLLAGLAIAILVVTSPASSEGVPKELSFSKKDRIHTFRSVKPVCPTTNDEWVIWRDGALLQLFKPDPQDNLSISLRDLIEQSDEIDQFVTACRATVEFAKADKAEEIIGNLGRFTKALAKNADKDHRFGFNITDAEFLARSKPQVDLPPLLASQEFLRKISDINQLAEAKKMIDDHNSQLSEEKKWITIIYKSRFLTTPDCYNTFGRFFLLVPDNGFEKWIQFGIKIPDYIEQKPSPDCPVVPEKSNNLSIVSVAPIDRNGKSITLSLDYWRNYQSDGSILLKTRYESVNQTENCFMCHKTAPLGIRPEKEYILDAAGKLVENSVNPGVLLEEINSRIEQKYGTLSFGPWLDPSSYGPTIGPRKARDLAYMRACVNNASLSDNELARVGQNMRCESCHNDTGLGPLNVPQALRGRPGASVAKQVKEYVMQGWMPPNNNLSIKEREALHSCLIKEYFDFSATTGVLIDWLKRNN